MSRTYESLLNRPNQRYDIPEGARVQWSKGHDLYVGRMLAIIQPGDDPRAVASSHRCASELIAPVGALPSRPYPRFLVARTATRTMHVIRFVDVIR